MSADRNLLFGVLAVQLGVATPAQVVAAATDPTPAAGADLAARLEAAGVIAPGKRRLVEEMVAAALAAHAGDEAGSLRSFGGTPAALQSFGGPLPGPASGAPPAPPEGAPAAEDISAVTSEHPGRYNFRAQGPADGPGDKDAAELGRGGIGRVLVAFDEHLGRQVALKELLPAQAQGPAMLSLSTTIVRFLREARVTGQLEHPNIVPVYELGRHPDGALYYTMRFVRGRTLADRLEEAGGLAARLRLLGPFWDMCNALSFAHSRGVVHRDVKPANVMVGEFGETVVLDWGLAKARGKEDLRGGELQKGLDLLREVDAGKTAAGEVLGTPLYMSPEQAAGELEAVDERSDVWSLGAVLYEILTGQPPFEGGTVSDLLAKVMRAPLTPVRAVCRQVPPELAAIAEKALQRDKARRYQNARELAEEMEAYLTGGRVRAHVYSSLELLRRFASRNKVALAVSAAAFFLLLALGVFSYLRVVAERNRAVAAEQTERLRWAEAQREGAKAALAGGDLLEARARLRGSLELQDSAPGRALWWQLAREPLVWSRTLDDIAYDVSYSPDGGTIAVACGDRTIYLFDARTRALVRELRGHPDQVFAVAFAPTGGRLASGGWGGEVMLWDARSGEGVQLPAPHAGAVYKVAFSPDGRTLASGSVDRKVKLWALPPAGLEAGPAGELLGHEDNVDALAFGPDGRGLATGGFDKSVRWWTRGEGGWQLRRTFAGHTAAVLDLDVSPDGALVASVGRDGKALLWDIATGQPAQILAGHPLGVVGVRFSPDGKTVATACKDKLVRLWLVSPAAPAQATGAATRLAGHGDSVRRLSFSPDGKYLASASFDRSVRVWDWRREQQDRPTIGHAGPVNDVAWSPDGRTLVSASHDKTLRLWDAVRGEQLQVLEGHTAPVWSASVSPDGASLASGGDDAIVRVWSLATGVQRQALYGHEAAIHCVQYGPDGALLASAGMDRVLRLWETGAGGAGKPGNLRTSLAGHTDVVRALAFSPDGRTLASGGRDGTIRLWDVAGAKQLQVLQGHGDVVRGLGFSPDGNRLVSGSSDRTVRLWELATGAGRVLTEGPGRIYWATFHPDGARVGHPSSARTARILDLEPGHEGRQVTLAGHRGEVNVLRFSPDGARVATCGDDGTVRLWDPDSGRPIWRAPGLLSSLELFSHRGWSRPGAGPLSPEPRGWREAVAERARLLADQDGRLCLATFGGDLELWDMTADRRLRVAPAPGIERLIAVADGCLALAGGEARLVLASGEERVLASAGATAIAWDDQERLPRILVAADRGVLAFSPVGEAIAEIASDAHAVALAPGHDWIAMGTREGGLALLSRATGQRVAQSFEGTPSSPVEGMRCGESTLAVGYANGLLGLWDLETGKRLAAAHLHGPVSHLQLAGGRLIAVTELGSALSWDLGVFSAARCDIVRDVWDAVPVVWEEGRPVLRAPPENHPCRDRPIP